MPWTWTAPEHDCLAAWHPGLANCTRSGARTPERILYRKAWCQSAAEWPRRIPGIQLAQVGEDVKHVRTIVDSLPQELLTVWLTRKEVIQLTAPRRGKRQEATRLSRFGSTLALSR